jgi:hypothetical protein
MPNAAPFSGLARNIAMAPAAWWLGWMYAKPRSRVGWAFGILKI